jgi:glucoamylase
LTGERAHYELAAGNDIAPLIQTYEKFATPGQMLPEQVWDEPNRPGLGLRLGQPGGSAVPLVWAHAEYLKLLRSARDGKVFDRVDPVYQRYCEPEGRKLLRRKLQIYSRKRPIQKITAGDTLRILDEDRFEVVWSVDGWKSTRRTASHGIGTFGFTADIEIPATVQAGELSWTLQWTEKGRWLGYNVQVKIESPANAERIEPA